MRYNRLLLFVFMVIAVGTACTGIVHADLKFGEKLVIEADRITDEAVCIGEDVHIFGTVTEDAVSLGGDVIIERGGKVNGDVVSLGGDIKVESGGVIQKDAVAIGGRIRIDSGGEVKGEKVELSGISFPFARLPVPPFCGDYPVKETITNAGKYIFLGPFIGIVSMLGFFIVTVLLIIKMLVQCGIAALSVYLVPQRVSNMAECVRTKFIKVFLVGLVSIIIIPFFILLLIVSLLGIPLVPLAIGIVFVAYLFGSVGIALWVGRLLPIAERRTDIHNAILGVLVIGLVRFIPAIGFIIGIVTGVMAIGVVVITRFGANSYPE